MESWSNRIFFFNYFISEKKVKTTEYRYAPHSLCKNSANYATRSVTELTVKAATAVIAEHLSVILAIDGRTIPTTAVWPAAGNVIEIDPCFAPEVFLQGPSPSASTAVEAHSDCKQNDGKSIVGRKHVQYANTILSVNYIYLLLLGWL